MAQLTLGKLEEAVSGPTAAFRCRTGLQPAGGEGDKVFPPTYAGAVYATEKRRLPDRDQPVECVLLDSVQSQANRMEEALQQAVDEGRLKIPVIEVDFAGNGLLTEIGKVTSLQAPHRIADAILRDSLLDGKPFRQSEEGKRIDSVSLANATPLYELCPTALVFGMWDSTGPKGGLGAKFQRAMVSEIVGIDAVYGVKTSSRIDPLQIRSGITIYEDVDGNWTLENTRKKYGRNKETQGKPSAINHGNVTPAFTKYVKGAEGRDPLRPASVELDYRVQTDDETLRGSSRFRSLEIEARQGAIAAGGVTVASAEQMVVLSLPALRRLQFPLDGGQSDLKVNQAGRTVLAALGLCAAALTAERGFDLRSRCLLWPSEALKWELLGKPGTAAEGVGLDADAAIQLLNEAVETAAKLGLTWRTEPLKLQPSPQLVALVRKSQELSAAQGGGEEGGE
ncbi:MAG: type I-U CRISPR-associated protein Cas7 [Planctomyces sp.]|nr:type I-U CRISPR-associated protein Cas7 [Planctomyces sp.]